jgi:hypothetical protein
MAALAEAFQPADVQHIEKKENPQTYHQRSEYVQHVKAARHILGVVGGNEVSIIKGNVVDLESDLLGITRPTTRATARAHLPQKGPEIVRNTTKGTMRIDTTPQHLPTYQMWAYPVVVAPLPLEKETCARPEKY